MEQYPWWNWKESLRTIQQHKKELAEFFTHQKIITKKHADQLIQILSSWYVASHEQNTILKMIYTLHTHTNDQAYKEQEKALISWKKNIKPYIGKDPITSEEFDTRQDYRRQTWGKKHQLQEILEENNINYGPSLSPIVHGFTQYFISILDHNIDSHTGCTEKGINMKHRLQSRMDLQYSTGIRNIILFYENQQSVWWNIIVQVYSVNKTYLYDTKKFIYNVHNQNHRKYRIDSFQEPCFVTKDKQRYTTTILTNQYKKYPLIGIIGHNNMLITSVGRHKITNVLETYAWSKNTAAVVMVKGMTYPQLLIDGHRRKIPNAKHIILQEWWYKIEKHNGMIISKDDL